MTALLSTNYRTNTDGLCRIIKIDSYADKLCHIHEALGVSDAAVELLFPKMATL